MRLRVEGHNRLQLVAPPAKQHDVAQERAATAEVDDRGRAEHGGEAAEGLRHPVAPRVRDEDVREGQRTRLAVGPRPRRWRRAAALGVVLLKVLVRVRALLRVGAVGVAQVRGGAAGEPRQEPLERRGAAQVRPQRLRLYVNCACI